MPECSVFQDAFSQNHICPEGHKFTDSETSRAARLLRLQCNCTSLDSSSRLSKHERITPDLVFKKQHYVTSEHFFAALTLTMMSCDMQRFTERRQELKILNNRLLSQP